MADSFFYRHKEILFVSILLLLIIMFGIYRGSKIQHKGVYTISKIIKYESDASGSSLYLEVYFQGRVINTVVNSVCFGCDKVNPFYFVRLIKQNPKNDIIFMEDSPVPKCILNEKIPDEGWKEIPKCNN